jgi:hypothetical protein
MCNLQYIKIMDDSPKIGNMLLVISVYTLNFVGTSISQHGKIYLDNSLQVQYYLPETSFWKIQADVQKIIHHSLDSVFVIAEPQDQREPLYGTCRLPMIGFRLLVMPFKMVLTSAKYWLLTVQTQRFLVWETENTAYRIIINKCKFWSIFSSYVLWKYLDLENTWSLKQNFRCNLVSPLPFVPALSIYCTCIFITNWWSEDCSFNT